MTTALERMDDLLATARGLSPMHPDTWAHISSELDELVEPAARELTARLRVAMSDPQLVALERRLCVVAGLDVRLLGAGRHSVDVADLGERS